MTFGASLGKKLLFPTSTVESPNTKTAGETAAVVSVERAAKNKLRRRKVVVFFAIGNELKVVIPHMARTSYIHIYTQFGQEIASCPDDMLVKIDTCFDCDVELIVVQELSWLLFLPVPHNNVCGIGRIASETKMILL